MTKPLELHINGQTRSVLSDPETPVIYILRNELGLVGTKQGCSLGQCGACTILVEGKAERACTTAAESLQGKCITTIEGLEPSFIKDAFIVEQAAQCGYCIPGIIMTAAALVNENPVASREDIRAALKENLCRCGTHSRILKAIEMALQTKLERQSHA
ncbi:MAG: (2Fe-2S)-binding protein [Trueperaceae bacterium]|nr:(2Fe-2S)-binding protein [Trueperaceae bacterium]